MRYRRRRNKKQRKIIIVSMCSLLLFMTIGYAAMQSNLEIKAKGNVVKKATGAEAFLDNIDIITSGDGLYKDSYEDNVYTYRGANPNNYVTFNGETWRIISANTSDNTIKIMINTILEYREYDYNNGRYNSDGYCNYNDYCNIWGSDSTLYDTNLNPITILGREYNGTAYALPSKEAELNIYLNGTYYNGLNVTFRSMIKEDAVYKAGVVDHSNASNLQQNINQVSNAKWKGKVALIDATEYVRASTNSSCTNVYSYVSNNSCYNNSSNHNWMFNSDIWWTMSPFSFDGSASEWIVNNDGKLYYNPFAANKYGIRPVVTLSPEVEITGGDGSENNPFQLSL